MDNDLENLERDLVNLLSKYGLSVTKHAIRVHRHTERRGSFTVKVKGFALPHQAAPGKPPLPKPPLIGPPVTALDEEEDRLGALWRQNQVREG